MSSAQCAGLLSYPSAATQLQLRNEVLEHAHPKLILWYTFSESYGQGDRWSGLTNAVDAPYPATATVARAKHTKGHEKHRAKRHSKHAKRHTQRAPSATQRTPGATAATRSRSSRTVVRQNVQGHVTVRRKPAAHGNASLIQSAAPIRISVFSLRMSGSLRRMQPCDGSPGMRYGSLVPWMPTIESSGNSVSAA